MTALSTRPVVRSAEEKPSASAVLELRPGHHQGADPREFERNGHMGLAGMRERIGALGGTVRVHGQPGSGALLEAQPHSAGSRLATARLIPRAIRAATVATYSASISH